MAREANPLKTELVTLSLNRQTIWYLDRMVELGFCGNTRSEAARFAIYEQCKILIGQQLLQVAPPVANIEMTSAGQLSSAVRR